MDTENRQDKAVGGGRERVAKIKPYNGELELDSDIPLTALASFGAHFQQLMAASNPNPSSLYNNGMKIASSKLNRLEDDRRFKLEKVKVGPLIGEGRFGKVYKATTLRRGHGEEGKEVALKQYYRKEQKPEDIYKERDFLIHLKHKRVINLIGAFHEKGSYLILELSVGSLADNLIKINSLFPRQKLRFAIQLLQGLEWIHSKNIIHCSIRPTNCLVNLTNNLVIGGFGQAQLLPKGYNFVQTPSQLGVAGYSDAMANSRNIFSKSSDVFAAAYSVDVPRAEYVRAMWEGRLINSKFSGSGVLSYEGKRQLLSDRVKDYGCFGALLSDMVHNDYYRRSTATQALQSFHLYEVMKRFDINEGNLESHDEIPKAKNSKLNVRNNSFKTMESSPSLDCVMHWIYYDEELVGAQQKEKEQVGGRGEVEVEAHDLEEAPDAPADNAIDHSRSPSPVGEEGEDNVTPVASPLPKLKRPQSRKTPGDPYSEKETRTIFRFLHRKGYLMYMFGNNVCRLISRLKIVKRTYQSVQTQICKITKEPRRLKRILRAELYKKVRKAVQQIRSNRHTNHLPKSEIERRFGVSI
ncbi:unnamed protein product [Orchesella dallaii]|uniref:Protein kinase domain-containing protein n=1 Tax=Orchesella dallaii TaxID=48710 RepID=A0ABP1R1G7_9HEXA